MDDCARLPLLHERDSGWKIVRDASETTLEPNVMLPRRQIEAVERHLENLGALMADGVPAVGGRLQQAVEQLRGALEELRAAKEELRSAQEQLSCAHRAALAASDRYRALFHAAPLAYVVTDRHGVIEEVNESAAALLGQHADSLAGRPLDLFVDASHPGGLQAAMARISAAGPGAALDWEMELAPVGAPPHRVVARARELTDAAGNQRRVCWMLRDVTRQRRAEIRLHQSEARMRAVVDTAVDAIITIDVVGSIQSFNPAARRIFGYSKAEVMGRNVKMLMPSSDADHHDGYLRSYLETGETKIIGKGRDVIGRRKDGTEFPMHLSVNEIRGTGAVVAGFAAIVHDLTERKELERRLAEAAVDERRRLAQDLHDSLGGQLAGIALLGDLVRKGLEKEGSSQAEAAAELINQVRASHALVRRVSRGLLPVDVDERGLMAAFKELVARTQAMYPGVCTLVCEQPVTLADNFVANHLFRIVEEALQNAERHARAERIVVRLAAQHGEIVVTVEDDGIGIRELPEGHDGIGLQTMRYRAGLIGASLIVTSGAESGTLVNCTLPLRTASPRRRG